MDFKYSVEKLKDELQHEETCLCKHISDEDSSPKYKKNYSNLTTKKLKFQ